MNNPQKRSTLLWMYAVVGEEKWYIAVLLLVQIVLGSSSVLYAMLLREIVNTAVDANRSAFFSAAAFFAGLMVFQLVLRAVNRFFEELSRSTIENRFKERLFSALLTKDYASVTKVHSGEWMNRLTSDTIVVADGLSRIFSGVAGMTVKMVGALLAILFLEPSFLFLLIPGGLLLIFFTYSFRKVSKRLHKRIQEEDGRLRVFLSERLSSLMIVRSFAQEQTTQKKAVELMEKHQAARMHRNHFSNFCNIGFGAAMNGAYVLGAVFCGYGILNGTVSYGNLMAILQLISQIQNPLANITGYLPKYYAMLASAERLMEVEQFSDDYESEEISKKEQQTFYEEEFSGIILENVSFTYQPPVQKKGEVPSMPVVLKQLNLEIKKGEYVAFIGSSGCGKSTVLKLLMCLYPLDEGERYLLTRSGSKPLTAAWRSLFAYVPQGNQLMSGSIREIIAFGNSERMKHEEAIHHALQIACAEEFVSELEQGIDTLLGERGTGLSEGQMQRIAIARAVFSEHPILLLDEATSSLDEVTEARLLANLRSMTDKTVIIVTHHPAVLSITDKTIDFSGEGKTKL